MDLNPINLLVRVPIVLLALTVHEFAHAYSAYRMGDPTAYRQGRLSLNPLKHLDPLGAICLMFAPIGWAKPVPINPLNFRDRRRGILVSTAAGPISNLAQAVLFALLLRLVVLFGGSLGGLLGDRGETAYAALVLLGFVAVIINVGLAVFNCLPLYPLDGFHIALQLMRPESQGRFAQTAPLGPYAILALVLVGSVGHVHVLNALVTPPAKVLLVYLAGFPRELVERLL